MLQLILFFITYFQVLDLNGYISQLLDLYNTITGISADMPSYSNFITMDNINSMTEGQTPDMGDYLEDVKCPRCAENCVLTYVQPGKHCPVCNQPC